jgi:hypothetical protein
MTQLLLLAMMFGLSTSSNENRIDYGTAHLERRISATKTSEKISVDGKLDEPAWANAPVATDFIQTEPKEGEVSAERTEVRVLYDSQTLYFGMYAHDSGVKKLVINDLKKDFSTDSTDMFELVLDTFHDERNGYIFSTNAGGAKGDAQMINDGREVNSNWDAVWYVKTSVLEDGWVAEIAIPFKSLKFREQSMQTWGVNFHRSIRSNLRNEDAYWAPLPRIYNIQRVSLAGTLEGLEGVRPGSNLRFKPYATSSFSQSGATGKKKTDGELGFDAKYGITSGLTWDFTYNTDFSQVEADEQQVNLTRFSLFFPEKREFFLENSGIFKFGGGDVGPNNAAISGRINGVGSDVFFFSRSIGLSTSDNLAVPILGGTRLTGRAGSYELGFINMQQRESSTTNATNFTIARLKRNIMANSDIGVMFMHKEALDSPQFNRVMGADANLRFGQNSSVNAFLAKSSAPGINTDNLYGRVTYGYQDSAWQTRAFYNNTQSNFIDEMGYLPRRGVQRMYGDLRRSFRPDVLAIRQLQPHIVIDYFADAHNNIDSKYVDYHFPIFFQNGAMIEMGKNSTVEVLKKPFSLNNGKAVVPAGVYDYYDYFVFYRPDVSRLFQPSARWGIGPFYGGYKHTYTVGETLRISHKFNTSLQFTHNNISLPEGRFKTNLLSTRFNYAFSTSVFLNALVQYNSDTRQWTSNVRFNVIHHPLSDFFFVYNERRNTVSGDLMDRALIAKVTYMFAK